jgi:hypothetical protein
MNTEEQENVISFFIAILLILEMYCQYFPDDTEIPSSLKNSLTPILKDYGNSLVQMYTPLTEEQIRATEMFQNEAWDKLNCIPDAKEMFRRVFPPGPRDEYINKHLENLEREIRVSVPEQAMRKLQRTWGDDMVEPAYLTFEAHRGGHEDLNKKIYLSSLPDDDLNYLNMMTTGNNPKERLFVIEDLMNVPFNAFQKILDNRDTPCELKQILQNSVSNQESTAES